MQHRKDDIDGSGATLRAVAERRRQLHGQTRLDPGETRVARAGKEPALVLQHPMAGLVDADEDRLEAGPVERLENVARREDGNLVLGRLTPEHDADPEFFVLRHGPRD